MTLDGAFGDSHAFGNHVEIRLRRSESAKHVYGEGLATLLPLRARGAGSLAHLGIRPSRMLTLISFISLRRSATLSRDEGLGRYLGRPS